MIGIKIDSNGSDYHIWFSDTKQDGTGFYGFYYVLKDGKIMEWWRSHKEHIWYINVDNSKRIRKFLKCIS